MKKPSLAAPLAAQEMKLKTPKRRQKERSIHEKELAEIARDTFRCGVAICGEWGDLSEISKDAWRSVVTAVLEEALYRVEKSLEDK
jgi:hypothetical protein